MGNMFSGAPQSVGDYGDTIQQGGMFSGWTNGNNPLQKGLSGFSTSMGMSPGNPFGSGGVSTGTSPLTALWNRVSNPSGRVISDYTAPNGILDMYNQGGPAPPPTVSNAPLRLNLDEENYG